MAQATAQRTSRRSPLDIVVDRVWRFFCSVRAAVYEIAILAVLVLIGTLRGSDAPQWIADAIPITEPVVERWYDWDVFHSLPFMLILAILSIAITICTINRAPGIWRTITRPTIPTTYGFLRSAETAVQFRVPVPEATLREQVVAALRDQRYRVLTAERGTETHIYADRNRFAKLGTFPFHLALILVLVGGIVGAKYGFREMEFIIPEGSVREVGHGTGLSVELIEFTDSYTENATPSEYRSDLVIYKEGEPVKRGEVTVNHPISYRNVTFYQADFGQAVSLRVTAADGTVLFNDAVPLGLYRSRENPEAPAALLDLPALGKRLHVIAPDENPRSMAHLDTLRLQSGEMWFQVRSLAAGAPADGPSAVVAQGAAATLDGITVEFLRERRFTLLQVASNPGIPIFFAASFLMIGGLGIVLYFPHRRVRGIVGTAGDNVSTVDLAPLVKRDWSGRRDFDRVAERLEARLGVPPAMRRDPDAGGYGGHGGQPDTANGDGTG